MTSEQQNKITVHDNTLYLKDFEINDDVIVSYFENLAESEELEKKVIDLLKIGITVTQSISTAENVNYVDKAFENLGNDFTAKLNTAFGEKGLLSDVLKDNFGEDGKIIKDLFNPNREGSPLYLLKTELGRSFTEIKEKLDADNKNKLIRENSPAKGVDFENQCEEKLEWIAKIHSDKFERTGNEIGKITGSKKGDFVLTLGDIGKKIVFEMKNRKSGLSEKIIREELETAIENRGADYGIFVVKNKDSLPKSIGSFNEYDEKQLICAVENDGETMIDGEIIHIAYKWARARLRLEDSKEKKIDATLITAKTGEIRQKIEDMKEIRSQCTNIQNSTESIRKTATDTEKEIKKQLDEIIDSLSA